MFVAGPDRPNLNTLERLDATVGSRMAAAADGQR